MKTNRVFPVLLTCVLAGCSSSNNPYGFTWAVATVATTAYDDVKCAMMKHVYAAPGISCQDFELSIEKNEKNMGVVGQLEPGPNSAVNHEFKFRYEGRKAIYCGRFVLATNSLPPTTIRRYANMRNFVAIKY